MGERQPNHLLPPITFDNFENGTVPEPEEVSRHLSQIVNQRHDTMLKEHSPDSILAYRKAAYDRNHFESALTHFRHQKAVISGSIQQSQVETFYSDLYGRFANRVEELIRINQEKKANKKK